MTVQKAAAKKAPAKKAAAKPAARKTKAIDEKYDADSLVVLEGLDAVRKRPGMYIGDTGTRGLHHLLAEIVDNSVDEAAAGFATTITIELFDDGSAQVTDNGRGIPVGTEKSTGLSGLEVVFTKLHAGGKFGTGGYATAGGLHGVGASVVNALSSKLEAKVFRDGLTYEMWFQHGKPGKFGVGDKFRESHGPSKGAKVAKGKTGTQVRFWPDPAIFGDDVHFTFETVCERLAHIAFLVPGLTIDVVDHRTDATKQFKSVKGLADFVDYLGGGDPICDTLSIIGEGTYTETVPMLENGVMTPTEVERTCQVEVALRWVNGWDSRVVSYVNTVPTPTGGTHVAGFNRAVTTVVNETLRDAKILRAKEPNPSGDDVQEGLVAVVRAVLPEPQFEGQTKSALGTTAAQSIVYKVVADSLRAWAAGGGKKTHVRRVLDKVVAASRARAAARLQRDTVRRKSVLESSSLPAKLADCRSNDPSMTELLLVEGDSAAGPCFTGDTLVATVAGPVRIDRLAELHKNGVTFFGYAMNDDGDVIKVALEQPRLTRRGVDVVAVTLNDGQVVHCTPDHLFRLADGSYTAAAELRSGAELASLHRRGKDREMVWQQNLRTWKNGHSEDEPAITVFIPDNLQVRGVNTAASGVDVYDLSVPEYENFALEAGIFVHNCKGGRDSATQAVLPLRGKILNALKASPADVLKNAECQGIFAALGAGFGKNFDLDACRYGRVILLCDADVDGSHIRCLLLTLFHTYCRPLLEAGRVYAAMPPLYAIKVSGSTTPVFAYSDAERDKLLAKFEKENKSIRGISRFKGLGEMSVDELADTTLDPATRSLRQLTVEDAAAAMHAFELCMGDEVEPRRDFIISRSAGISVDELDV
jgi:DNA gyrase subunit B